MEQTAQLGTRNCPNCNSEIREERKSYYCRLNSHEEICTHPNRLTDESLCKDCEHLAIVQEKPGTLVDLQTTFDGPNMTVVETHRCWQCNNDFRIRTL